MQFLVFEVAKIQQRSMLIDIIERLSCAHKSIDPRSYDGDSPSRAMDFLH